MSEPLKAPKRGGASTKASSRASTKAKAPKKKAPISQASRRQRSTKRTTKNRTSKIPRARGTATKATSQASTPAPHSRITKRREAVLADKKRKRLLVVSGCAAFVLLLVTGWAILHLSVFRLHHLEISGNTHESRAVIESTAGLSGSPALIDLRAGTIEHQLQSLPWIKSASVSVVWPSTVKLVIHERTMAGAVKAPTGWAIVDGNGRVLQRRQRQPAGLPIVQLATASVPPVGSFYAYNSLQGFTVAGTLPVAFKDQVSLIVVHRTGTITLHLTSPVIIELGQATELSQKYEDIAAVIAGATLHAGDVLDVSVPQSSTISGP